MVNKVVVIALVAVVVVSGIGIVALSGIFNDDENYKIVIEDGAGNKIKLKEPLDSVIIANTNIPKMCNIIGANDYVKGLSFYSEKSDSSNWDKFSPLFPNAKHMSTEKTITAEEITPVAKAIIVPVSSMTISNVQEKSFKEMGITVIRLNCNGDTAQEDMKKLTILFGEPESITKAYNDYWELYNGVKNAVIAKVQAAGGFANDRFLYYYSGLDAFYNQTSASSSLMEDLAGKNALREIDNLDLSGVSNEASQLGLIEKIIALDSAHPIDRIFFRGSSTTVTEDDAAKLFKDSSVMTKYSSLAAVTSNEIYLFNSEMMSGCLSYLAYVFVAEILGVDTGYSTSEIVDQYNEKYNFSEANSGLAFKISVSGSVVTASELAYV